MVGTNEGITGHCQCGAIRFRVSGEPVLTEFCHCPSCRRASGAPLMAWAAYDRAGFVLTEGKPVDYASSPGVTRTFCGRCGTSLTLADERFPEIYVAIASFDEPEAIMPEFHIWRAHRLSWVETSDDLPRYLRFKHQGELEAPAAGGANAPTSGRSRHASSR